MCYDQGHKWTLKSLWRHFDAEGIDHSVIWEKIKVYINTNAIPRTSMIINTAGFDDQDNYQCRGQHVLALPAKCQQQVLWKSKATKKLPKKRQIQFKFSFLAQNPLQVLLL